MVSTSNKADKKHERPKKDLKFGENLAIVGPILNGHYVERKQGCHTSSFPIFVTPGSI